MKTDIVTLNQGGHRVDIVPAMGAVAAWSWLGRDIFRPSSEAAIAARDPLGLACFAMAPWVSRVRDSRFNFHGRMVSLKPESDPRLGLFAIHGEVWRAPWQTIKATHDSVLLKTTSPGAAIGWPWAYACAQQFSLDAQGLTIALSLTSLCDEPFPYTHGLHPYFVRRRENRLTARVKSRAILSPDGMPLGQENGWGRWDDTAIPHGVEDHCYGGWDGIATIAYPADGYHVRVRATGCDFLQVYAPDENYFCVEPQTGGPDALNRGSDGGVRILEPRTSETITVSFTPEAL